MVSNCLPAQPQLALIKKDRIITHFDEGEYIRFKKKGDNEFTRAIIIGIHPGFIKLGTDTIYHYEIDKVDLRGKIVTNFKVASLGKGLMIAGVSLILIDVFNTLVIRDRAYEADSGVVTTAIVLTGVGAFTQIVNNNYFKVGRRKKVASLNL